MNEQSLLTKAGFTQSLFLWPLFQELFPANKRSCEHFAKYFTDAGLEELSEFVKNQQSVGARKELQKELQQQISCGEPLKDVSLFTFTFTFICGFYILLSLKKFNHNLLIDTVSASVMWFVLLFPFQT